MNKKNEVSTRILSALHCIEIDVLTMQSLMQQGATVHCKNNKGENPLFTHIGSQERVAFLLDKGALLNEQNNSGNTPLHKAVKRALYDYKYAQDIVYLLLERGACIEKYNKKGQSPFDVACTKPYCETYKMFEQYGYLFFPRKSMAFNPIEYLRNNAQFLREIADQPIGSADWVHAEQALTKIFDHIDGKNRVYIPGNISHQGIAIQPDGIYFRCATAEQCDYVFGEKTMQYAREIVKARADVINYLLNIDEQFDTEKLNGILAKYPVSTLYQEMIVHFFLANQNNAGLLMCLEYGFDPDGHEKSGRLLYHATEYGNADAVELLVSYGGNDKIAFGGLSLLDVALYNDDHRLVEYLVNKGALIQGCMLSGIKDFLLRTLLKKEYEKQSLSSLCSGEK